MTSPQTLKPRDAAEIIDAIADAARAGRKLEIRGGGSKSEIGAPIEDVSILDMSSFTGITDYDAPELVLTAGAGTPLAEIKAQLASQGQMLAFEPFDHGPVFGAPAGAATIGGIIAAGVAGSRRLTRGGARDHFLGFKAVSGHGEVFSGGAKVVKNVTGYDLPKLLAGSWGRLAALTEVTVKVLPRAPDHATRMIEGLDPQQACLAMSQALGSQADVSAAAYLPALAGMGPAITALRVEGFGPSVAARCAMLQAQLQAFGPMRTPADETAAAFWSDLRSLAPLAGGPLWRICVAARHASDIVAALAPLGARWLFDWAGGLIWLAFTGAAEAVRGAAKAAGGHAMLVRAPEEIRRKIPALPPQAPGILALEARVRRSFDPNSVFETGRFMDAADAD